MASVSQIPEAIVDHSILKAPEGPLLSHVPSTFFLRTNDVIEIPPSTLTLSDEIKMLSQDSELLSSNSIIRTSIQINKSPRQPGLSVIYLNIYSKVCTVPYLYV